MYTPYQDEIAEIKQTNCSKCNNKTFCKECFITSWINSLLEKEKEDKKCQAH